MAEHLALLEVFLKKLTEVMSDPLVSLSTIVLQRTGIALLINQSLLVELAVTFLQNEQMSKLQLCH